MSKIKCDHGYMDSCPHSGCEYLSELQSYHATLEQCVEALEEYGDPEYWRMTFKMKGDTPIDSCAPWLEAKEALASARMRLGR